MECSAKSVMSKDFLCEKKLPYGSVFLLLLCVEKIPIFQGHWRLYLSIRLSKLFLLIIFIMNNIKIVHFHHM